MVHGGVRRGPNDAFKEGEPTARDGDGALEPRKATQKRGATIGDVGHETTAQWQPISP